MYGDDPVPLQIGDEISWDVKLIDGEANGWPPELLVSTTVTINDPPSGVHHGAVATTPQLDAAWGGTAPIGSRFSILAALSADWLNPPFQTLINGQIKRLHVAWVHPDATASGWPDAPMRLIETSRITATTLRHRDPQQQTVVGLVAEVDIRANRLSAF
jgi:hypothetical protein